LLEQKEQELDQLQEELLLAQKRLQEAEQKHALATQKQKEQMRLQQEQFNTLKLKHDGLLEAAATATAPPQPSQKGQPQTQTPMPQIQEPSNQNSNSNNHLREVSLCLMIMDANHEIIEWLAYHYYTLNVRRIIVYNDPKARTTPWPILQRWQPYINITLWDDQRANYELKGVGHEGRQSSFYGDCYKTFAQEGRRWVAAFDPDEYATINERVYIEGEPMYQMGLATLPENSNIDHIDIPSAKEPGSTLTFILNTMAHVAKYGLRNKDVNAVYLKPFETGCIQANRKQYSPYEDDNDYGSERREPTVVLEYNTSITTDPPFPSFDSSLKPSDFTTWRWRYWGKLAGNPQKKLLKNHVGKALLDLTRLSHDLDLSERPNIHAPIPEPICSQMLKWANEQQMPLLMHHYPLSWEQSMFRASDSRARGNLTKYRLQRFLDELDARDAYEPHGHILEWLPAFVESIGVQEAARLLQHAGNPQEAAKGAWLDPQNEQNAAAMAAEVPSLQQLFGIPGAKQTPSKAVEELPRKIVPLPADLPSVVRKTDLEFVHIPKVRKHTNMVHEVFSVPPFVCVCVSPMGSSVSHVYVMSPHRREVPRLYGKQLEKVSPGAFVITCACRLGLSPNGNGIAPFRDVPFRPPNTWSAPNCRGILVGIDPPLGPWRDSHGCNHHRYRHHPHHHYFTRLPIATRNSLRSCAIHMHAW